MKLLNIKEALDIYKHLHDKRGESTILNNKGTVLLNSVIIIEDHSNYA